MLLLPAALQELGSSYVRWRKGGPGRAAGRGLVEAGSDSEGDEGQEQARGPLCTGSL